MKPAFPLLAPALPRGITPPFEASRCHIRARLRLPQRRACACLNQPLAQVLNAPSVFSIAFARSWGAAIWGRRHCVPGPSPSPLPQQNTTRIRARRGGYPCPCGSTHSVRAAPPRGGPGFQHQKRGPRGSQHHGGTPLSAPTVLLYPGGLRSRLVFQDPFEIDHTWGTQKQPLCLAPVC